MGWRTIHSEEHYGIVYQIDRNYLTKNSYEYKIVQWGEDEDVPLSTEFVGNDREEAFRVFVRIISVVEKKEVAKELLDNIKAIREIINEAAVTGFNPKDGDWAERLFASQGNSFEAVKNAEKAGIK